MISFDEAVAIVGDLARPLGAETVKLESAQGRILAEPVTALVPSPPRPVSTMDGYAVRDDDLANLPARLPVGPELFAGAPDPSPLEKGQCARIFTGAPVPPGADRVVIQEVVERDGADALFRQPPSADRNIRSRGCDFDVGETLLDAGRTLGPRELVAVAAGDHAAVRCWRRPRVAILATGDELAPPGSARDHPGTVPESVSPGVAALVRDWGGDVGKVERLADKLDLMETAAAKALDLADLIIVTGGASVGEKDFARRMFEPFGLRLHFAKVAIKPGKPVWLGQCGTTLVLGLPGNPTSAMATARLLLAPLVAGLAGGDPVSAWQWRDCELAALLQACGDRETFARGAMEDGRVRPLGNQESGAQATLAAADVLIRSRPHDPVRHAGETVEVLAF